MNTNKWGPAGWNLLGPAALRFDRISHVLDNKNLNTFRILLKTHLTNTENMLPCKYCRESYHQYIRELPIERSILTSDLNKWLYDIHNKVNAKLRKQGYNDKPDPTLAQATAQISRTAQDYYKATGWDYIHCIGHNYAEKPDALSMIKAKVHFSTLPYLMPHPELVSETVKFMKDHPVDDTLDDRNNLVLWIYLLHQHLLPVYQRIQPGFSCENRSYADSCAYYETFRAGCGLSAGKKGPSCRLPVSNSIRTENLKKMLNTDFKCSVKI